MARQMKDSGVEWIGEIPDEWSIRRIKNLFFVISGATPSSNADNWDGEIIWITPADYKTNDKYIAQGKRNLSVVGYNNCSTSLVPVGSLIFSKRAPIGTVAMNAVPLCTNQGCLSCVKKNEEIDTTYYYYVLSVGTEHFELMGSGTTFKEISASTFSNCSLPFPEVADQRRIADYLDAKCAEIDKVVEKTRETIEEYKKLKQSIITEAVTKGLNSDAEMKDSGIPWIGKIPVEWKTSRIKYSFTSGKGLPITKDNLVEDGLAVVSYGQIHSKANTGTDIQECLLKYVDLHYQEHYPQCEVFQYDFIFADTSEDYEGCGNCAYKRDVSRLFGGYHVIVLHSIQKEDNRYYAYLFKTDLWRKQLREDASGVKVFSITQNILVRCRLLVPPKYEQHRIADYLDAKCTELDSIIEKKEQLIEELGSYKKSLIYEYVTGKKEVQA